MSIPFCSPPVDIDLKKGSGVTPFSCLCLIPLDMSAATFKPIVDVADSENEHRIGVCPIECRKVSCDGKNVRKRIKLFLKAIERRPSFDAGLLDARSNFRATPVQGSPSNNGERFVKAGSARFVESDSENDHRPALTEVGGQLIDIEQATVRKKVE